MLLAYSIPLQVLQSFNGENSVKVYATQRDKKYTMGQGYTGHSKENDNMSVNERFNKQNSAMASKRSHNTFDLSRKGEEIDTQIIVKFTMIKRNDTIVEETLVATRMLK